MRGIGFSIFLLSALTVGTVRSQDTPAKTSPVVLLDLSRGFGFKLSYVSAASWLLFGLDEGQRIQAGVGLRANYHWANSGNYEALHTPTDDTLRVPNPRTVALNAAFHVRLRVAGPMWVGTNFDFVGVGFGPERVAEASTAPKQVISSRPALFNLARDGADSRGSLTSELYAAADLPQRFVVRVGYSRASTAYTTNSRSADAVRYRRRDNMLALGLSYTLP